MPRAPLPHAAMRVPNRTNPWSLAPLRITPPRTVSMRRAGNRGAETGAGGGELCAVGGGECFLTSQKVRSLCQWRRRMFQRDIYLNNYCLSASNGETG